MFVSFILFLYTSEFFSNSWKPCRSILDVSFLCTVFIYKTPRFYAFSIYSTCCSISAFCSYTWLDVIIDSFIIYSSNWHHINHELYQTATFMSPLSAVLDSDLIYIWKYIFLVTILIIIVFTLAKLILGREYTVTLKLLTDAELLKLIVNWVLFITVTAQDEMIAFSSESLTWVI